MVEALRPRELSAELQNYFDQFNAITHEVRGLTAGLTDEQWNWSPAPKEWSLAQCVDHLNVVHGLLVPRFAAGIAQGRARSWLSTGDGPVRHGAFERLFIKSLQPDGMTSMQAPGVYRPAQQPSIPEVLPRFLELQQRLVACVQEANGLDLKRIKVRSPAVVLVRISLSAWFAATVAHGWNHVGQAQRLAAAPGFPE
ncbi:MAG: DinB family protein [Chloroflexaceae bacterium]|nr:DinB family protein [Chloroflexaceae bacterium]